MNAHLMQLELKTCSDVGDLIKGTSNVIRHALDHRDTPVPCALKSLRQLNRNIQSVTKTGH